MPKNNCESSYNAICFSLQGVRKIFLFRLLRNKKLLHFEDKKCQLGEILRLWRKDSFGLF